MYRIKSLYGNTMDWYMKAYKHFKIKIEAAKEGDMNVEGRNHYVYAAEEVFDLFRAEANTGAPDYVPLAVAIEKK